MLSFVSDCPGSLTDFLTRVRTTDGKSGANSSGSSDLSTAERSSYQDFGSRISRPKSSAEMFPAEWSSAMGFRHASGLLVLDLWWITPETGEPVVPLSDSI